MTNTELLMKALGWQGGTVHQVARATGLKVEMILDLDQYPLINNDCFESGLIDSNYLPITPPDLSIIGMVNYYQGVISGLKNKLS